MVFNTGDNCYSVSRYQVNQSPGLGNYTTIASAMAAAAAAGVPTTIFVMPGTYTENVVLVNGISLASFNIEGGASFGTQIVGHLSDGGNVVVSVITGISLQTNGSNFLNLSGSGSYVILDRCDLRCSNFTGINVGTNATVQCYNCEGDLSSTVIGYFSGTGNFLDFYGNYTNSAGSTTISSTSANVLLTGSSFLSPVGCTLLGGLVAFNCTIDTHAITAIPITTSGSGSSRVVDSYIYSGTNSAITIGTGTTLYANGSTINGSNVNSITGSGTLYFNDLKFVGNTYSINTTTQIPKVCITGCSNIIVPGAYPYTCLGSDEIISVNTSSTANTINLPASPFTGKAYTIKDGSANAATHNVTISGNGNNIIGTTSASTFVISANGGSVDINYDGSNYLIL